MSAGIVQFGTLAPVWPTAPPSAAGSWLIDTVSSLPLGDPLVRSGAAAASFAAATAALTAGLLSARGHGGIVAVASALAIGLVSYGGPISGGDLPASLAALLSTLSMAIAASPHPSRFARVPLATGLLLCAGMLQPPVLAVLPLVVVRAIGGVPAARIAMGIVGALIGGWWVMSADEEMRLADLAVPWRWPFMLALLGGALGPLWGALPAATAFAGSAVLLPFLAGGQTASALAMFPTMLLARGVDGLPTLQPRSRDFLAVMLLVISIGEVARRPAPETWRLLAWRDAVERVLPPGTRMTTGSHAAATLNGPLFAGRPAGLSVVVAPPARDDAPHYRLGDYAASTASMDPRLVQVPLSFVNAADLVARLPDGTVVGVAMAASDAAIDREEVRAVLARLGHQPMDGVAALVVAGVIGQRPAPGLLRHDGRLQVLIGEPLTDAGQRSPTELEMRVMDDGVRVFLRGRNLATGRRWAVIAVRPGGPLIGALADGGRGVAWPINLPGLDVWRRPPP